MFLKRKITKILVIGILLVSFITGTLLHCKKAADPTPQTAPIAPIVTRKPIVPITPKKPFKVYGFIVYPGYLKNGVMVKANYNQLQQYLLPFGINKINLIYEQKLLDYPNGDKPNAVPNLHRIDSLATYALSDPTTFVSLDMESWNRYNTGGMSPTTPQRILQVINEFKSVNNQSPLGLYAIVPQNTYGYQPNIKQTYDPLNNAYTSVASMVDYFSPSLYNYNGTDTASWALAAQYNIQACRNYNMPTKEILPYITPTVTINGSEIFLSYTVMQAILHQLYMNGADGCIIWTSSSTVNQLGNTTYVDVTAGWAKAVIDFSANPY